MVHWISFDLGQLLLHLEDSTLNGGLRVLVWSNQVFFQHQISTDKYE